MPANPPEVPPEFTVGEVAHRSGLPVSTIHFYEAKGLIRSRRSAGNQRRYPRGVLRLVAIVKVAQRAGVPLRDIQEALSALPGDRRPTAEDWTRMSSAWKENLDLRIASLVALRDQLSDCIGCGCLSLTSCPLRNPGDMHGKDGPGPRLLTAAKRSSSKTSDG